MGEKSSGESAFGVSRDGLVNIGGGYFAIIQNQ